MPNALRRSYCGGTGLLRLMQSARAAKADIMFERYTEKARRVVFFARYEASQFGSPYIETEHLLLGVLREDKALSNRFLRAHASVESTRKQIEAHTMPGENVPTSVDLPLSNESKRVLAYAAEEAERLAHKHIGTEHLLLGLLREEKCFAAEILHERGLRLPSLREELANRPHSVVDASPFPISNASLVITSEPMGAEIEINGAFYGNTPAQLPLPAGEKTIRVTLKGFHPWERKLQMVQGGQQNINAELEPLTS
jgi:PEGA domain/Clp amino terminal domain, pathogenicity island component